MFTIFYENLVQSYMCFIILFYAKYMPGQFVFRYLTDMFVSFACTFLLNVLLSTYILITKNKTTDAFSVQKTCFKQYILIDILYMYKLLHNFYEIIL